MANFQSLDDLRGALGSSVEDYSDEELISLVSRTAKRPYAEVADSLGYAGHGTTVEAARQLYAGATVDVPKMLGQGMQWFSPKGSALEATGKSWADAAEQRSHGLEADMRGRGELGKGVVMGARAVAPMLPVMGASIVNPYLGMATAGAFFGGSGAQDTKDNLMKLEGMPEAEANQAGWINGAVQGIGDAASSYFLGGMLKPVARAFSGGMSGVAKGLTDTSVLKPMAKAFGLNMLIEPATEAIQDSGTEAVERAYGRPYGRKDQDLGSIAYDSALGGAGLTALLAPFGLAGHRHRAKQAGYLKEMLYGEDVADDVRAKARGYVVSVAKQEGIAPDQIDDWVESQTAMMDERKAAAMPKPPTLITEDTHDYGETVRGIAGRTPPPLSDKEHAKREAEYEAWMNSPAGQRVSNATDDTGLERDLTIADQEDLNAGLGMQPPTAPGAPPVQPPTAPVAPTTETQQPPAAPYTWDDYWRDEEQGLQPTAPADPLHPAVDAAVQQNPGATAATEAQQPQAPLTPEQQAQQAHGEQVKTDVQEAQEKQNAIAVDLGARTPGNKDIFVTKGKKQVVFTVPAAVARLYDQIQALHTQEPIDAATFDEMRVKLRGSVAAKLSGQDDAGQLASVSRRITEIRKERQEAAAQVKKDQAAADKAVKDEAKAAEKAAKEAAKVTPTTTTPAANESQAPQTQQAQPTETQDDAATEVVDPHAPYDGLPVTVKHAADAKVGRRVENAGAEMRKLDGQIREHRDKLERFNNLLACLKR